MLRLATSDLLECHHIAHFNIIAKQDFLSLYSQQFPVVRRFNFPILICVEQN